MYPWTIVIINLCKKILHVEAYSELCQTSKMAFCENSERLKAVDILTKRSIFDIWQSSEYPSDFVFTFRLHFSFFYENEKH